MSSRRPAASALLALALTVAGAAPATAQLMGSLDSPGNYHIETDLIQSNINTGDFTMPHKVRFTRPGTTGSADSARGNSKQGVATLTGNVVIHDSGGAPEAGGDQSFSGRGPATIACDTLQIDSHTRTYVATGHVRFTQGGSSGSADRAVLNRGTNVLQLDGDVTLTSAGSSMHASSVNYNLATKDVTSSGGVQLRQPMSGGAAPAPAPRLPTPKPRKKP